jgi:hypothetical protein
MRVNLGLDIESAALLAFTVGYRGTTATAPTATTFTTDAVNIPVNSVAGQYVVVNATTPVVGIIQSNTSATNSVLTIDRWYDLNSAPGERQRRRRHDAGGGRVADRPGAGPASYMGLTATATAPISDGHDPDGRAERRGRRRTEPAARDVRAHGVGVHDDADKDVHDRRGGHDPGHARADGDLPGRRRRVVADGVPDAPERDGDHERDRRSGPSHPHHHAVEE